MTPVKNDGNGPPADRGPDPDEPVGRWLDDGGRDVPDPKGHPDPDHAE